MTCSILSAIIASTKVPNCIRNPGCRIAAKERRAGGGAAAVIFGSMFKRVLSEPRVIESPRYLASLVAVANRCSRVASMQECADACVVWNNSRIAVFGVAASPGARYGNGSPGIYAGKMLNQISFSAMSCFPIATSDARKKCAGSVALASLLAMLALVSVKPCFLSFRARSS
jgi:hypothetical protein